MWTVKAEPGWSGTTRDLRPLLCPVVHMLPKYSLLEDQRDPPAKVPGMAEWPLFYGASVKGRLKEQALIAMYTWNEWIAEISKHFVHSVEKANPCSALCKYSPRVFYEDPGDLSERTTLQHHQQTAALCVPGCWVFCHISLGRQETSFNDSFWLMKFSLITLECFGF